MAYDENPNATIVSLPLSPMLIWKKLFYAVGSFIFAVVVIFFQFLLKGALLWLVLLGFIGIVFAFAYFIYARMYVEKYYYDVKSDQVVIRRGVIMIKELSVPFENVQNVYVEKGFFDMVFGLYSVRIETATAESIKAAMNKGDAARYREEKALKTIEGMSEENASKLKQMLLGRVGKAAKE